MSGKNSSAEAQYSHLIDSAKKFYIQQNHVCLYRPSPKLLFTWTCSLSAHDFEISSSDIALESSSHCVLQFWPSSTKNLKSATLQSFSPTSTISRTSLRHTILVSPQQLRQSFNLNTKHLHAYKLASSIQSTCTIICGPIYSNRQSHPSVH